MHALVQIGALALTFGILERVPGLRFRRQPLWRRGLATDALHLSSHGLLAAAALAAAGAADLALTALGAPRLAALEPPLWLAVPLALVLVDVGHYAAHLAMHRVDALWGLHKVHHSSLSLDWLATYRSHLGEQALRHGLALALPVAVGVPLDALALAAAIFAGFAALNHSNLALPLAALEPVFVTPRLHRLHHVTASCDRNLGAVLTCWDRLRGTLRVETAGPDAPLGVPGEAATYPQRWLAQQLEPLRGRAVTPR